MLLEPRRAGVLAALALTLPACATDPADPGPAITSVTVEGWFPQWPTPALDLLVVIDPGAAPTSIVPTMAQLAATLEAMPRGLPSLHVGVVSADLGTGDVQVEGCTPDGDDARLLTSGCDGVTAPYLEDLPLRDGQRARNYSGGLDDRLGCVTALAPRACAIAQPLEAMRRALDPARNPGFRRDDATLMVILVSDRDDCSVRDPDVFAAPGTLAQRQFRCTSHGLVCDEDLATVGEKHGCAPNDASPYLHGVDEYADLLAGASALVAVIAGPAAPLVVTGAADAPTLAPACSSSSATAAPAVRLRALPDRLPRATAADRCDADLSPAFALLAELDKVPLGAPCLSGALHDRDPQQPGLQPECAVTEIVHRDAPDESAVLLPACDASESAVPCWQLIEAPACQGAPEGRLLRVARHGGGVRPDTVVHVQCVGA